MSRRRSAVLGAFTKHVDVGVPFDSAMDETEGPPVTTWAGRIGVLQSQGVTVHRWCRCVDTSGSTLTMQVGSNGTINEFDEGGLSSLILDETTGKSMALNGGSDTIPPNPTSFDIATVEEAVHTFIIILQADRDKGGGEIDLKSQLYVLNTGIDEDGGHEIALINDGVGGFRLRVDIQGTGGSAARVTYVGSTQGQVTVGTPHMIVVQRLASTVEAWVDGIPITLNIQSGTESTWPAPAAGTSYIGSYLSLSGGFNGLFSEFLITSTLTAAQIQYLALQGLAGIVTARDITVGTVEEGTGAVSYDVGRDIHPESPVTVSITTPATLGTAAAGVNQIIYTPPASVSGSTADSAQYRITHGTTSTQSANRDFNITVTDATVVEEPSGLEEDEPLPAADVTVTANPSNFNTRYNAASLASGTCTHIVLDNGNYGSVTLSRNKAGVGNYGVTGKPIVIRTANADGRPGSLTSPTSSNSALFARITIEGDGHVLSGLAITGGSTTSNSVGVRVRGSFCRVTRCTMTNIEKCSQFGNLTNSNNPATFVMMDHCNLGPFGGYAVFFVKAEALNNLILARNWTHDGVGERWTPGGTGTLISGWGLSTENVYREVDTNCIMRFNYFGPTMQNSWDQAWVHNKTSGLCVAFNSVEAGSLFNQRHGINCHWVGNYAPGVENKWHDYRTFCYGNRLNKLLVYAGSSEMIDTVKHRIFNGIFEVTTSLKIAGCNISTSTRLGFAAASWATSSSPAGNDLPQPVAAGGTKPARTHSGTGITYDAYPEDGITIRAHSGPIIYEPNLGGFDWVENDDVAVGTAAPSSWKTDLFDEYPWIEDICPDPTSLTGGIGGQVPWKAAQDLTRGSAGSPNTGPNRDSAGGLPGPLVVSPTLVLAVNYAGYDAGNMPESAIPWAFGITHVMHHIAGIVNNGPGDSEINLSALSPALDPAALISSRNSAGSSAKLLLQVGGPNSWTTFEAADQASLIEDVAQKVYTNGYDGFDTDIEFPGQSESDVDLLVAFHIGVVDRLVELGLSSPVSTSTSIGRAAKLAGYATFRQKVRTELMDAGYLDYFFVQCYALAQPGFSDRTVWHSQALHTTTDYGSGTANYPVALDETVAGIISPSTGVGWEKEKFAYGLQFGNRRWNGGLMTGVDAGEGAYQPEQRWSDAGGVAPSLTGEELYRDIVNDADYGSRQVDTSAGKQYFLSVNQSGNTNDSFLSFYEPDTITEITDHFVTGQGHTVAMVWHCGSDYNAAGATLRDKHPLLAELAEGLGLWTDA